MGCYNVCLVRSDSRENWWKMYMLVHLHKHTRETLPVRAWNVLWIDWLVATPRSWVARDWVAWQTRSAWLGPKQRKAMKMGCWGQHVGSDVSICTMLLIKIGHDRRGQHSWVAKRCKTMKMGCYGQRVESDVSICTILKKQHELLRNKLTMCKSDEL